MLTIWHGISTGAVLALVAIGFNIVYVASGTLNFAQPEFLVAGAFVSYLTTSTLNWPVVMAIPIGLAVGAVIGILEERIAIRPLRAGGHGELVTTLGWSVVMVSVILLIWGPDPLELEGFGSRTVIDFIGGRASINEFVIVALAVATAIGFHVWLRATLAGLANLATAEDREAATLRGINVKLLSTVAFAMGGGLLGALGPVVGPQTYAIFNLGALLVMHAFVVLTIGGYGSNLGVLVGALAVGVTESLSARYLGASYANLSLFVLLMGVLLLRPQGLFGMRSERVV
ncbi:branched-chain amino acid ABC transporter permease [Streptosporangium sp. NBC_01755]|uniref:branched-chain amino acid ABC transporter permease n=1 Tax=unclassified Streptosporangium TaxID=2632669 RepID=UPI002DD7DB32|nr:MULTISPECIES: branched-chain amino acid ABC transporter permease [unclassified Streptosporangium]WSA24606.1 branched-chain amino acid ABC transporter permease [Streptosporangium sp. NBC_01810]WSC97318.1 branched-chain amino acid ABC transporter permease [Streptosporangium sp. NBC_01755]